ncbi:MULTISPECIES: hypothetical protein [Bradyrhizobium]|uniref:hypothetical protein n=1 Tax=Bradyrhizobium TaxID=374 RepID=UPI001EDA3B61|nr:hypothetical protein [Bradyrhizobium zhengyangense]MCG2645270.1 hypothetical protein [Bradyrhizobium zhengyangense]
MLYATGNNDVSALEHQNEELQQSRKKSGCARRSAQPRLLRKRYAYRSIVRQLLGTRIQHFLLKNERLVEWIAQRKRHLCRPDPKAPDAAASGTDTHCKIEPRCGNRSINSLRSFGRQGRIDSRVECRAIGAGSRRITISFERSQIIEEDLCALGINQFQVFPKFYQVLVESFCWIEFERHTTTILVKSNLARCAHPGQSEVDV